MNNHRINSGLTDFDNTTDGIAGGQLITIAGRPATGKTAFAITLMVNIGIEQQIPVAFFAIEMDNIRIVKRILKNWSFYDFDCQSVNSEDIKHTNYQQELCKLSKSPIYLDDTPSISIDEMESRINNLISFYGVKLVIIDYFQLIKGFEVSYDEIMKRLKALAVERDICIINLSQLYKNFNPLELCEFHEADFRDATKALMSNSDTVALLYRPELSDYTKPGNLAELKILKGHQNDTIQLTFFPDFAKFTNRDSGECDIKKSKVVDVIRNQSELEEWQRKIGLI